MLFWQDPGLGHSSCQPHPVNGPTARSGRLGRVSKWHLRKKAWPLRAALGAHGCVAPWRVQLFAVREAISQFVNADALLDQRDCAA